MLLLGHHTSAIYSAAPGRDADRSIERATEMPTVGNWPPRLLYNVEWAGHGAPLYAKGSRSSIILDDTVHLLDLHQFIWCSPVLSSRQVPGLVSFLSLRPQSGLAVPKNE